MSPLALVGLAAVAALYFSLTCAVTLEWIDEGLLVYQSWLVSQGAVPHREFQHVYGPAMYLVNGLLLRLFGSDLFVIRASLVVLKAIVSVFVYLAARRVASRPFALVAFASTVAVWGGPWWVFNTPYPGHYAVTLVLLGMLLFLRSGGVRGALLAGVCCGLASTFKQTTGLFALLSLLLCLVWDASASPLAATATSRLGPVLRRIAVLGSAAIGAGYLAPGNTAWNLIVLGSPFALGIALVAVREMRYGATAGFGSVDGMIAASLGMAAPLMLCAAAYAVMGLLGNLLTSTVSGLPQMIKWFIPVAAPDAQSSLIVLTAFSLVAGVHLLARRRLPGMVALAVGVGASAITVLSIMRSPGIFAYFQQEAWIGDVFRLVFAMPFVATSVALLGLIPSTAQAPPDDDARSAMHARVLCALLAASGLLLLYPAADFWHLVMMWPFFAPLLAWQLERVVRPPDGRTAPLAVAVVGALVLVCVTPFVHAVVKARLNRPAELNGLSRASYIGDGSQKLNDAAAVVRYLEGQPADRLLLSFGEGQMLYFLAGRRSILDREESAFYLVGMGLVAADDARVLLPQAQVIARIGAAQPIIVILDGTPSTTRLRDVFAELAAYIDANYRTVATFGPYRILLWGSA